MSFLGPMKFKEAFFPAPDMLHCWDSIALLALLKLCAMSSVRIGSQDDGK